MFKTFAPHSLHGTEGAFTFTSPRHSASPRHCRDGGTVAHACAVRTACPREIVTLAASLLLWTRETMQAALQLAATTCGGRTQQRQQAAPRPCTIRPVMRVVAAAGADAAGGAAPPPEAAAAAASAAAAAAGSNSEDEYLELPEAVHSMTVPDFNPNLVPQLRKHFDTRCGGQGAGMARSSAGHIVSVQFAGCLPPDGPHHLTP